MATLTPPHLTRVRAAVLAGDAETAGTLLGPILCDHPGDYEARYWFATALKIAGDHEGAAGALNDARTLHAYSLAKQMGVDLERCARDGRYAAQVGTVLYSQHHVAMASVMFSLAVSKGHFDPNDLLTYGLSLQHQGRIEEAIEVFEALMDYRPSAVAHQFLLYPHLLLKDQCRYPAQARRWAALYAPETEHQPFANRSSVGRKLRVGYVAPSFAASQVRQFLTPVLEAHDRETVEVFLYPAKAETENGWKTGVTIHAIGDLSDADAAALIRRDRIDVLVDCWGHTAGSRLAVFAQRPAPVQAAWINFVQTTGLDQIDYVLHADAGSEFDVEDLYSERIWTIGPVFNVFRPSGDRAPVGPTPALASGMVTFGSFNHPCKWSDETMQAWGCILRQAPMSRLLLKYRYLVDPVLQRATEARLASWGADPHRVLFEGETRGAEYIAAFGRVDLALDPSPAPGSTTTLEALSNGVPVLTLVEDPLTIPGLYARSQSEAAGLADLVTSTWDDYVARAVELAADLQALDALRARVRPGFDNGPLRDEVGFTRRVEGAFREMFERSRQAPRRGAA